MSTEAGQRLYKYSSLAGLAGFCLVLYLTADRSGAFWWYDSASHALNGVFLLDLLRQGGWMSPLSYALNYFAHYPALTIGFYPPGFAIYLVPFYALFGVSQASAQIAVSAATFLMAWGALDLARRGGYAPAPAFAAALLSIAFPEMLVWERQIQPEVLSYALAVWSLCFLLRWLDHLRPRHLLWAGVLFVASLYVKQTTVFLAAPMLIVALLQYRARIFQQPGVWRGAVFALVIALPLAAQTLAFGGMNLSQVRAAPEHADKLYYVVTMPQQIGIAVSLLALAGMALSVWRSALIEPRLRNLCLAWIAIGLIFFSLIALKSTRFSTAVLPPFAIMAIVPFGLLPGRRLAGVVAVVFSLLVAIVSIATTPERYCTGFTEVAHRVAEISPAEGTVLLHVHRSGNFVFDLRADEARPDLRVLRAEKLYTVYRVSEKFGIVDSGATPEKVLADIVANNVATVAVQRGFLAELPSFAALHDVLKSPPFKIVASVPIQDSEAPEITTIVDIYRREDYKPQPYKPLEFNFPIINWHVRESK